MNREVQVLVAAMHAEPKELAGRMNLSSDAIIIDQCERDGEEEFTYHKHRIRCFHYAERGVGKAEIMPLKKQIEISAYFQMKILYTGTVMRKRLPVPLKKSQGGYDCV